MFDAYAKIDAEVYNQLPTEIKKQKAFNIFFELIQEYFS